MQPRFEQFIRERQYLHNVTPATVEWYENSFKWLSSDSPSADDLKNTVVRMREKGRRATGCNSVIRAVNAYLHWSAAGSEVKCSPSCKHLRVPQLKEPQMIPPTFTAAQVSRLANWKPRQHSFYQRRLHLLTLLLLDTDCRISEALTLRVADINMESLLATLDGKGRKQRIVPFSFELRKALHRYVKDFNRKPDLLLLASGNETRLAGSQRAAGLARKPLQPRSGAAFSNVWMADVACHPAISRALGAGRLRSLRRQARNSSGPLIFFLPPVTSARRAPLHKVLAEVA